MVMAVVEEDVKIPAEKGTMVEEMEVMEEEVREREGGRGNKVIPYPWLMLT